MKAKSGGAVMAHSLFVSQAAKGALRWFCVCILQHWSSCCAKYRDDRENINLNLNMATDVNSLQTSNDSRQREKPFPFAIHSPTELQVISNHSAFLRDVPDNSPRIDIVQCYTRSSVCKVNDHGTGLPLSMQCGSYDSNTGNSLQCQVHSGKKKRMKPGLMRIERSPFTLEHG